MVTRSSEITENISVAQGAFISVPIAFINRSDVLWGADSKEFRPERWLNKDGVAELTREPQGYRQHLLTFGDGPKACLGKLFAIAEIRVRRLNAYLKDVRLLNFVDCVMGTGEKLCVRDEKWAGDEGGEGRRITA